METGIRLTRKKKKEEEEDFHPRATRSSQAQELHCVHAEHIALEKNKKLPTHNN